MNFKHTAAIAAAIGTLMTPAFAHAQAKLVAATPATAQAASGVTTVKLTFNERLTAKSSGATLIMTGMPGMTNHPDMKMSGVRTAIAPDGKSIVLTSAKPLPAGTYRADWTATGADGRQAKGAHRFSVK